MPRKSSRRSGRKAAPAAEPSDEGRPAGDAGPAESAEGGRGAEAAPSAEDEKVMEAARAAAAASAESGAPAEAPGTITIDPGIVSQIATRETLAVAGVAGLAGGSFLGIGGHGKAVAVEVQDGAASITLRITVAYGRNVREVAERVRKAVFDAVTRMAGFSVTRVDVRVCGLKGAGAEEAEPEAPARPQAGPAAGGGPPGAPVEF